MDLHVSHLNSVTKHEPKIIKLKLKMTSKSFCEELPLTFVHM